jgi:hypothetical protein
LTSHDLLQLSFSHLKATLPPLIFDRSRHWQRGMPAVQYDWARLLLQTMLHEPRLQFTDADSANAEPMVLAHKPITTSANAQAKE